MRLRIARRPFRYETCVVQDSIQQQNRNRQAKRAMCIVLYYELAHSAVNFL